MLSSNNTLEHTKNHKFEYRTNSRIICPVYLWHVYLCTDSTLIIIKLNFIYYNVHEWANSQPMNITLDECDRLVRIQTPQAHEPDKK